MRLRSYTVVCTLTRSVLLSPDSQAIVFTLSSRLLLQALVAVPPVSSAGVVEELLATAAVSSQSETGRCRAIGVAADVLSLIASGDLSLSKVRAALEFAGSRGNGCCKMTAR